MWTMTSDQVLNLLGQFGPTIINLIAILAVIIKVLREVRSLVEDLNAVKVKVNDNREMRELKDLLGRVVQENYELKKVQKELLTKIDHIERK